MVARCFFKTMRYCLKVVSGTVLIAGALLGNSTHAEIIYDNSSNYEGQMNDTRLESGDEVVLAGTSRLVTDFAFEYFAEFTVTGDETARLRFYNMDGDPGENPFAAPGSLLYDSGAFTIASGFKTVNVADLSVLIPGNKFAWTVEFSGITDTETAGLLFYNPPTVGGSDAYFWQRENGAWLAVASDGTGNNFAAQVNAIEATATQLAISARNQGGTPAVGVTGATPGKAYALEFKSTVTETGWQRAGVQTRATAATFTLLDPAAQGARFRLYRVLEQNTTIARANNQASIVSFAVPGRRYALQRTTNFNGWSEVEVQTATGSTVTFNQAISNAADEFYRVVEVI